ncbi:hypothetical protein EV426DRAFT_612796 [Tirmania nivea]|nr:hypothetical protein EV426DRAFT_612796 [Tirmania nivea]
MRRFVVFNVLFWCSIAVLCLALPLDLSRKSSHISAISLPSISHQEQLILPTRSRPTIDNELIHPTAELKNGYSNLVPPSDPGPEFPSPSFVLGNVLQFIRTVYEIAVDIFPRIFRGIGAVWDSIVSTAQELYPCIRDQILAWYAVAVQFFEDHPGTFVVILLTIFSALFWRFSRDIMTAAVAGVFLPLFLTKSCSGWDPKALLRRGGQSKTCFCMTTP